MSTYVLRLGTLCVCSSRSRSGSRSRSSVWKGVVEDDMEKITTIREEIGRRVILSMKNLIGPFVHDWCGRVGAVDNKKRSFYIYIYQYI